MILTNVTGLPEALVKAVTNDPYHKGNAEFSVTELISPARQGALKILHKDELKEDVSDRLWALYGQIAHLILERANIKDLAEKRFFGTIAGTTVSGQVDSLSLEKETLTDWKFTSARGFYKGKTPKPEWVMQLNFQLELLRQNGLDAKNLQIGGLFRDYSALEAARSSDYPQAMAKLMHIPLWPREKTVGVMEARIKAHKEARAGSLPECSPEERWQRPSVYAVMKEGRKSAVKLYQDEAPAKEHAAQDKSMSVVTRPGEALRCSHYCPVKELCTQYKGSVLE